ncbi:MAG TPA: PKD domain-containing protein, partial [Ignavibacteriales bacterium]|nr:PKD domain-containing protein [Ignavibacteriales bacterium]
MKRLLMILLVSGFIFQTAAYNKLSVVERFTNWGCGPCATLNNAWYNATTAALIDSGLITHIIYNVDWPSDNDPMYLLNSADNNMRRGYYGVNAVPWIEINGTGVSTTETAFMNAVTNGNAEYAPFNIVLTPERFSNNVINVHVKIIRDPADATTFGDIKLRVALTEKSVDFGYPSPNGETIFFSVCRKMLPDGHGINFTIPAPGDSTELDLMYIPTMEFSQAVNFDSIRVVAFIQSDDTKETYQSTMTDLVVSNNVNAAFQVEENLGASPFTVQFTDYSTATDTTNIISWEWDFDNDGTIDSHEPEPTWVFTNEQSYTVSLTVSDGNRQHTRTLENYITVLGATSDILVVNGIEYATYTTEMENFYNSSACFGNHQVDIWDLFGNQGFDYSANPNIQ